MKLNIFLFKSKESKKHSRGINLRRDSHGLGNYFTQKNGIKTKRVKSAIQIDADFTRKTIFGQSIAIHTAIH